MATRFDPCSRDYHRAD